MRSGCRPFSRAPAGDPGFSNSMMLSVFALPGAFLIAAHHPVHHTHHAHHHHHTAHFHHILAPLRHHLLHSLVHSLALLNELGDNCRDCVDFLVGRRTIHVRDELIQLSLLLFPFGHHISHVHSHHASRILSHHSHTAILRL